MNDLITIATFDNSIFANISKGKLESEGIECYFKDENIISLSWWNNIAYGGIKLCVEEYNVAEALKILEIETESEEVFCPTCNSTNVLEKKSWGWIKGILKIIAVAIISLLEFIYLRDRNKIVCNYKCEDCGTTFTIEWN